MPLQNLNFRPKIIDVFVVVVRSRKIQFNPRSFAIELSPIPHATCGNLVMSHPRSAHVALGPGESSIGKLLGLSEFSLQTPCVGPIVL